MERLCFLIIGLLVFNGSYAYKWGDPGRSLMGKVVMNRTEKSAFTLPILILLAAVLIAALSGCTSVPKSYSAAPLGGRVVDRQTREPIVGAYVVAIYKVEMGKSGWPGVLHFEETRTDHEGRFHFNGVEKMTVPKEWIARNARLYSSDPELYVFADGYQASLRGGDPLDRRRWLLTHRVSTLDGGDFPLRTFDGLTFERKHFWISSDLGELKGAINTYINPATGERIGCTFDTIPMTWSYFSEQIRKLESEWIKNYPRFNAPQASDCTKQGE